MNQFPKFSLKMLMLQITVECVNKAWHLSLPVTLSHLTGSVFPTNLWPEISRSETTQKRLLVQTWRYPDLLDMAWQKGLWKCVATGRNYHKFTASLTSAIRHRNATLQHSRTLPKYFWDSSSCSVCIVSKIRIVNTLDIYRKQQKASTKLTLMSISKTFLHVF